MPSFRELLARAVPLVAPNVLDPLTAKLAEAEGFEAIYLGGGPLGYVKCITEAVVSLPDMVDAGLAIRAACPLPLVLDGTCGWGDPMHVRHTIRLAEAAGFAAIELEDQVLPKRAHHHVGIEHVIPQELMVAKIREAVRARRDPDFLIIGRTNAARCLSRDEALRRAEAYRKAGADMLFVLPGKPDDVAYLAGRLPPPLMYMTLEGGLESIDVAELGQMGYRFIVDPMTPVLAYHRAMRQGYRAMRERAGDPLLGPKGHTAEHEKLNATIGLEELLAIERQTVEAH